MKAAANFRYEKDLWSKGVRFIAGIDEVGRGAWAGPVVASAVVFQPFFKPPFEVFDSKLLQPRQREALAKEIKRIAFFGVGVVGVPTINKVGIGKATQKAFRKAVRALTCDCEYYLIDAFYIRYWTRENQLPIKKGDRTCASIAAASIVAKVYRDNLMRGLAEKYPQYGFDIHKGYGTAFHQEQIRKYKLSGSHRKSFDLSFLLT
ncbi:MAG: ribonuclease HII [Candidatus Woykebacteria bacterium GWB1_45_5]|uniref:Ribonuclease n=2 Tax=Candidatus Woykeibacteriota TaxID=1817899 RepID=A0A1G1VZX2_9BACT|nr:MAG: ribonuclease HII [Candidatus Woykebacteria bacterium GWA1_44_8]OGY23558.1 MAG: ribonuclease HII [Candidatus Woykebacteria bacterium GWB1_45_5]